MTELIINELLNTLPFFILGYLPEKENMRYSPRKTAVTMIIWELVYLCIFALLCNAGFPSVWVQYLAVPMFIAMMICIISAGIGIILFHFMKQMELIFFIYISIYNC